MECEVCNKSVDKKNYHGIILKDGTRIGVCGKHYMQYQKYKKFLDSCPIACHDKNDFETIGDIAKIYTRNRKEEVSGFFIIDKDDLDEVIKKKWRLWKNRVFTGIKNPISITDFLLPERLDNFVIDHKNHNPLDNRRCNLRITTQSKNCYNKVLLNKNTSDVCGVWFDKNRNKWCAEIKCDYIKIYLGRYKEFSDACFARYVGETITFKDFRNKSNDDFLLKEIKNCNNQKEIEEYVTNRILTKYPECK